MTSRVGEEMRERDVQGDAFVEKRECVVQHPRQERRHRVQSLRAKRWLGLVGRLGPHMTFAPYLAVALDADLADDVHSSTGKKRQDDPQRVLLLLFERRAIESDEHVVACVRLRGHPSYQRIATEDRRDDAVHRDSAVSIRESRRPKVLVRAGEHEPQRGHLPIKVARAEVVEFERGGVANPAVVDVVIRAG